MLPAPTVLADLLANRVLARCARTHQRGWCVPAPIHGMDLCLVLSSVDTGISQDPLSTLSQTSANGFHVSMLGHITICNELFPTWLGAV